MTVGTTAVGNATVGSTLTTINRVALPPASGTATTSSTGTLDSFTVQTVSATGAASTAGGGTLTRGALPQAVSGATATDGASGVLISGRVLRGGSGATATASAAGLLLRGRVVRGVVGATRTASDGELTLDLRPRYRMGATKRMRQATKSPYVASLPRPQPTEESITAACGCQQPTLLVPTTTSRELDVAADLPDRYASVLARLRAVTKSPFEVDA